MFSEPLRWPLTSANTEFVMMLLSLICSSIIIINREPGDSDKWRMHRSFLWKKKKLMYVWILLPLYICYNHFNLCFSLTKLQKHTDRSFERSWWQLIIFFLLRENRSPLLFFTEYFCFTNIQILTEVLRSKFIVQIYR